MTLAATARGNKEALGEIDGRASTSCIPAVVGVSALDPPSFFAQRHTAEYADVAEINLRTYLYMYYSAHSPISAVKSFFFCHLGG